MKKFDIVYSIICVIVFILIIKIGIDTGRQEKKKEITFTQEQKQKFSLIEGKYDAKIKELQQQIQEMKKDLVAYNDKVDDLAVAFINHHGNFPRRNMEKIK